MQDYINLVKRLAKEAKAGKRPVQNGRLFIGDVYKQLLAIQQDSIVDFSTTGALSVKKHAKKELDAAKVEVSLYYSERTWFIESKYDGYVIYNFIYKP